MSKVGIELNIDVTKIDKSKLYQGQKGTYLTMTAFVELNGKDQYGNNGMITQKVSKEDQDAGIRGAILGNSKVFWSDSGQQQPQQPQQGFQPQQQAQYPSQQLAQKRAQAQQQTAQQPPVDFDDSGIPF